MKLINRKKSHILFHCNYIFNRQHFIHIAKRLVDKGNFSVVREPALVKKGLKGEQAINKV